MIQVDYRLEIEKQLGESRHSVADSHPCFSKGAHGRKGRIHLPVSPACNIRCRFCTRACNSREQRPGVAAGVLEPGEVVGIVEKALSFCPEITVVGVAGPGDALATTAALEAFRLIHRRFPHLIKCLSTNGLALPGKSRELWEAGVRTLTVTVNAVDPEIAAQVVSHVAVPEGQVLQGKEAGAVLVRRQLEGIREAADTGLMVKVNTVLIPTLNDGHIAEIARTVRAAGAAVHNIMPLIPQHEMAHLSAPTCGEMETARAEAEQYLPQFRHCRHCRADACGIVGKEDFSRLLYEGREMETFSHG